MMGGLLLVVGETDMVLLLPWPLAGDDA